MNWTLTKEEKYDPPRRIYTAEIKPYDGIWVNLLLEEIRPNRFTVYVSSNGKGFHAKRRKKDNCQGNWSVSIAKRHAYQCAFSPKWLEKFGYDLASIKEFAA